jgi:hypothetical protein
LSLQRIAEPLQPVTLSLNRVAEPLQHVTLSLQRVAEPLQRVTLSLNRVAEPLQRVTLSLQCVAEALQYITLLLNRVAEPLQRITCPFSLNVLRSLKTLNPLKMTTGLCCLNELFCIYSARVRMILYKLESLSLSLSLSAKTVPKSSVRRLTIPLFVETVIILYFFVIGHKDTSLLGKKRLLLRKVCELNIFMNA